MYQNENLHFIVNNSTNEQKSTAYYNCNSWRQAPKAQYTNILIYIGCISENAFLFNFKLFYQVYPWLHNWR